MFHSIRFKLASITIFAIAMCASLVFFLSIQEHEKLYFRSVEQNVQALSLNTADDLLAIIADDGDDFAISARLLQFDRHKDVIFVKVFTSDWQLIQQYIHPNYLRQANFSANLELDIKRLQHSITTRTERGLVIVQPIGEVSSPVGYLLIVNEYQRPLAESKKNLFYSTAPLVLLSIIFAIFCSYIVSRRILTPLLRLSKFTKKVEDEGDYTLKIEIDGNDEVSELGRDINSMLSTIHTENTLNKTHTQNLLKQQDSMQRLANYDTLTGLPNRMHFMELLNAKLIQCRNKNSDLTIIFFDVDGFKGVNDTLGHEVGDILLQSVSKLVSSCLREEDVLARLGGDEFLIMIPDVEGVSLGISIAERVTGKLLIPFKINSWDVKTGVSIGIANAKEANFEIDKLVSNADLAMYESKEKRKGAFSVFSGLMLEEQRRKIKIANLISHSLDNNEFTILYQLKMSNNGEINALEALLRWTNQELGFISPAEFIPIAEQAGLISDITHWVINKVFKDVSELKSICGSNMIVSLNVSSHDLQDETFIDYIEQQLHKNDVSIKRIQIEVTESGYLENFDTANQFFTRIHQMGGSIALDDFGTGYSSLSYLTKIKIDTLKIDRSFVGRYDTSDQDTVVLRTILELAHQLGLTVCSEGIETAGQASFLLNHGCQQMQGYYFAQPVPLPDLKEAMTTAKRKFKSLRNNVYLHFDPQI